MEDEETINSWGLDPQSAIKPAESTIDSYLDNPQSRFLIYLFLLSMSHFICLWFYCIKLVYFMCFYKRIA